MSGVVLVVDIDDVNVIMRTITIACIMHHCDCRNCRRDVRLIGLYLLSLLFLT